MLAWKGNRCFLGLNSVNIKNNCVAERMILQAIFGREDYEVSPRHEILVFQKFWDS